MKKSLGEKIKSLRKELNMTQTDLAGSEMTKSMLSQIENNLATPSMKNLLYIASKLGKPASYFLEDASNTSAFPIEEIQAELKEAADFISKNRYQEALTKLEATEKKHRFDLDSKLYADFLSKYGECLIELKQSDVGEQKIRNAVELYQRNFLYIDAAKSYLLLIGIPWNSFDYETCMAIVEEALEIYRKSISKDYSFEIETLYLRSILNAGLDKLEASVTATEEALEISRLTKIYYRSDELYKIRGAMSIFLNKLEHFEEYMEKARQFALFTDNKNVLSSIEAICGMYQNHLGAPQKAVEHLQKSLKISQGAAAATYVELAKSYYAMEKYQVALDTLEFIQYPDYIPFRYDYLHIWSSQVYKGLCLNKLGKSQEALAAVKLGIEKMEIVKESKALALAYKTLSEIYSQIGDYENAFAALKQANGIEEISKENKLYY